MDSNPYLPPRLVILAYLLFVDELCRVGRLRRIKYIRQSSVDKINLSSSSRVEDFPRTMSHTELT